MPLPYMASVRAFAHTCAPVAHLALRAPLPLRPPVSHPTQQKRPYVWVLRVVPDPIVIPTENAGKYSFEAGADAFDLAKIIGTEFGSAPTAVSFFRVSRDSALAVRYDPSLAANIFIDLANELKPDDSVVADSWLLARVQPTSAPSASQAP